jgi:solute carrier family 10 (sodium/bile acid cotransporter), member 7
MVASGQSAVALGDRLKSYGFDFYLVLLVGTVVLASLLPARSAAVGVVTEATDAAIALLFFLYGARLDTSAIIAGISNWRLQLMVLSTTFVLFPIIGVALGHLAEPWLGPAVTLGLIYLALLPSTVQSSIAFTSIAHGNVPAAVCAASVSNLLGVIVTPVLVGLLLHTGGHGFDLKSILDIGEQILLPFIVGQLARPFVGGWIRHHPRLTRVVDRGSILLIVYNAFSAGVVAGIWSQVDRLSLLLIIVLDALMLGLALFVTRLAGRLTNLSYADSMVLLFCGSKKSLASGLPMANILFVGRPIGLIVLPLMLFHQIQLFVCAIIAQRNGHRFQMAERARAREAAASLSATIQGSQAPAAQGN